MSQNNSLDELIPVYAENKREMESYKKLCDEQNAQIKDIMKDIKDGTYITGGYKAQRIVSEKETMNEDVLISLFTSVPAFVKVADSYDVVKTKPYIDFDVLEKIMYDGVLSDEQIVELGKATSVKEVISLRVTKIKEKK